MASASRYSSSARARFSTPACSLRWRTRHQQPDPGQRRQPRRPALHGRLGDGEGETTIDTGSGDVTILRSGG